jgi:hypothetical protein
MPALLAVHDKDPRRELLKRVGDISTIELFDNAILVAIYMRPNKAQLSGGGELWLPDNLAGKTGEDRYQGKVGLVVGKGPLAYVDDEKTEFHGQNVDVGDWVLFRPSDGWPITLVQGPRTEDSVLARILVEADIRARLATPDSVW